MKLFKTGRILGSKLSKWTFRISSLVFFAGIAVMLAFLNTDVLRITGIILIVLGVCMFWFSVLCDALLPNKITKVNPHESNNPYLIYGPLQDVYGHSAVPNLGEETMQIINNDAEEIQKDVEQRLYKTKHYSSNVPDIIEESEIIHMYGSFVVYWNKNDAMCPIHINEDFKHCEEQGKQMIKLSPYDRSLCKTMDELESMTLEKLQNEAYGAYMDVVK